MSSCSVDPLVVGRVIGDVVDMFVPSVSMSVSYNSKHLTNGCDMKPSMACDPPIVQLSGNPDHFYTLVMTDPDAPSPSEPSMREWVHCCPHRITSSDVVQRDRLKGKIVFVIPFPNLTRCAISAEVIPLDVDNGKRIVVDIPGGTDATQGKEVVEYMVPKPPVGIHRYVMVVFKQNTKLGGMNGVILETRAHFNTRNFARQLDLGIPVSTFYFNSQKEPASKRR